MTKPNTYRAAPSEEAVASARQATRSLVVFAAELDRLGQALEKVARDVVELQTALDRLDRMRVVEKEP